MKYSDATKNLMFMEDKRQTLYDHCTRALCGDKTADTKLLSEATGGRCGAGEDEFDEAAIKTLIIALRWLGLPAEKKTRKRRTTKGKSDAKGAKEGKPTVAKKRTTTKKPKGSTQSASKDNSGGGAAASPA